MKSLHYRPATEADLPFIAETYEQNIAALHGNHRTLEVWKELLQNKGQAYYIVRDAQPVAWFRLDTEEDLELGMLQVAPSCQRQGIGKFILSVTEALAKEKGFSKVIIHTTEDNLPAQALYRKAGYALTEVGPCTTADGKERVGYTFEKRLAKVPVKPVAVRPYRDEDYEAVSRIHDAARKIELALANLSNAFLPFCVASEREDFFDYPHIDVATQDEKVVGFSAYTEEELAWLYVCPDLFRQKIGSALIENALKTQPGICEIEVLYGNEPAKGLYETFGFTLEKLVNGVMPGNESFPVTVYCLHKEESL